MARQRNGNLMLDSSAVNGIKVEFDKRRRQLVSRSIKSARFRMNLSALWSVQIGKTRSPKYDHRNRTEQTIIMQSRCEILYRRSASV